MKITFQNSPDIATDTITPKQHSVHQSAQDFHGVGNVSGVKVNFDGADRALADRTGGANAFAQIQQAAESVDAKVQQDYMTLMSNIMSEEDYQKLQKDGFRIRQMAPEEIVTIVDKIKAELAKSGTMIAGYNDDLDLATLEAALGSLALAQAVEQSFSQADLPLAQETVGEIQKAWEMASLLEQPTDGAYQFMLRGKMEPEVENFYLAQSSGAGAGTGNAARFYEEDIQGYYTQAAGSAGSGRSVSADEFQDQIDRVIREAGREVDEKSRGDAEWLLNRNLPLTAENLTLYENLKSVEFPVTEEVFAHAAARAVLEGKDPRQANLATATEETVYEKANQLLEQYKEGGQQGSEEKELSDRRLLEEIRLRMTTEVNLKLLRSGFSIDTSSMEELVEALKIAERQVANEYFPEDADAVSKYEMYHRTNQVVEEIPKLPAQMLGYLPVAASVSGAEETDKNLTTLSEFYEEGRDLRYRLEQAGGSYEAMMTTPRADLGDSIQKAFAKVDDILTDLGLDLTAENQKAVRVLGYNRMDLSLENIEKVRDAQRLVSDVIEKMTPASVLRMIRDGVNPLEKDFEELRAYFDEYAPEYDEQAESYSHFLYRLERRGDISQEERESFIGIYRMLHQIEKRDGAAVGAVLHSDADLRFSGLLSAARSSRFASMDLRLSEQEEGFLSFVKSDHAIDKQIESAYCKQEMEEIRRASQAPEGALELLKRGELPLEVDNLLAANGLLNEEMAPFENVERKLSKRALSGVQEASALDQMFGLWQKMDVPDEFQGEYRQQMEELEKRVQEESLDARTAVDVKELRLLSKQIRIAGALSGKQEYYLPLEMENGRLAKLHLTIDQGGRESGKVTVEIESKEGKSRAQFWLADGRVSGILQGNGQQEVMKLTRASDIFSEYLREESSWSMDAKLPVVETMKNGEMTTAVKGSKATDKLFGSAAKETEQKGQTDQAELFRLAKMWIRAVTQKEVEDEN